MLTRRYFVALALLIWPLLLIVMNMIYMPLSEEPGLGQRFGADYQEYARHVPRWLPRRTPGHLLTTINPDCPQHPIPA